MAKKRRIPKFEVLKIARYKGCPIYLRRIGLFVFEYLLVYENQIYGAHVVITPRKGDKTLSKDDVNKAASVTLSGAVATIDTKLGKKPDKETKGVVEAIEKAGKKVFEEKDAKGV